MFFFKKITFLLLVSLFSLAHALQTYQCPEYADVNGTYDDSTHQWRISGWHNGHYWYGSLEGFMSQTGVPVENQFMALTRDMSHQQSVCTYYMDKEQRYSVALALSSHVLAGQHCTLKPIDTLADEVGDICLAEGGSMQRCKIKCRNTP